MKFGNEFASQMVQEWQDAYINYNSLKKILKKLQILNEQTAPSSPVVAATPRGTLRRRLSLYRAFSGLITSPNDDEVILVSAAVNEVSSSSSSSSSSGGGGGADEVFDEMFVRKLDVEFDKVVRFYQWKVDEVLKEADELSKQMDALIALRIKVDDPSIVAVTANGDSSAPSVSLFVNDKRISGWVQMDVIKQLEATNTEAQNNRSDEAKENNVNHKTEAFRPASLEVLNHVTVNVTPESPVSTTKTLANLSTSLKFNKQELRKAEQRLRKAFTQFHNMLRLLKSYSYLNILAFSKILKKYDKITSRNKSKAYMDMVEASCLASDEVSKLLQRVEATLIKHFFKGDRSKGMDSLRPRSKKERHQTTFLLGLFTGCAIALVVAISVAMHLGELLDSPGRGQYMDNIFPLYSLFLFIVLHMVMYSINIYYWMRFRVNYAFIFGFKQGTELGYWEVLLVSSVISVVTLIAVLSNLEMEADVRTRRFKVVAELVPFGLLVVVALVLFCPFNVMYRSSRFFFITSAFRCLLAPLYKVSHVDFFVADQFTSQVQAFRSLQFYICYYGWGEFSRRTNKCQQSKVYEVLFFAVAVVPYWLRFLQCLRRLFEEKSRIQGLNALKYLSTIVAVVTRTAYDLNLGVTMRIVAGISSGFATIFNTYWDIVIDWGLLERNSKNRWLRNKLMIPEKSVYFVAIVLNVILRLVWMQTVMGYRDAPFLHRTAMISFVACLEIIRRGIWNFFRMENEHLNNVGRYRALKSVPLPFNYDGDGEDGETSGR